jgi:hypothetical protein
LGNQKLQIIQSTLQEVKETAKKEFMAALDLKNVASPKPSPITAMNDQKYPTTLTGHAIGTEAHSENLIKDEN